MAATEETLLYGGDELSIPLSLLTLTDLSAVLSPHVWSAVLSEDERKALAAYLPPNVSESERDGFVTQILTEPDYHFGSPVALVHRQLKSGVYQKDVAKYRELVADLERLRYAQRVQDTHNALVKAQHYEAAVQERARGMCPPSYTTSMVTSSKRKRGEMTTTVKPRYKRTKRNTTHPPFEVLPMRVTYEAGTLFRIVRDTLSSPRTFADAYTSLQACPLLSRLPTSFSISLFLTMLFEWMKSPAHLVEFNDGMYICEQARGDVHGSDFPLIPLIAFDDQTLEARWARAAAAVKKDALARYETSFMMQFNAVQLEICRQPAPPTPSVPPATEDLSAIAQTDEVSDRTPFELGLYHMCETERYARAWRPFVYYTYGARAVVEPVRPKRSEGGSGRTFIAHDAPECVTFESLVTDAAARLPGGVGSVDVVVEFMSDSRYIANDTDATFAPAVSEALVYLSSVERDPPVRFDASCGMLRYLHYGRDESHFELPPVSVKGKTAAKANDGAMGPPRARPVLKGRLMSLHEDRRVTIDPLFAQTSDEEGGRDDAWLGEHSLGFDHSSFSFTATSTTTSSSATNATAPPTTTTTTTTSTATVTHPTGSSTSASVSEKDKGKGAVDEGSMSGSNAENRPVGGNTAAASGAVTHSEPVSATVGSPKIKLKLKAPRPPTDVDTEMTDV